VKEWLGPNPPCLRFTVRDIMAFLDEAWEGRNSISWFPNGAECPERPTAHIPGALQLAKSWFPRTQGLALYGSSSSPTRALMPGNHLLYQGQPSESSSYSFSCDHERIEQSDWSLSPWAVLPHLILDMVSMRKGRIGRVSSKCRSTVRFPFWGFRCESHTDMQLLLR